MLMAKGAFVDATNNSGAEPLQCCRPDTIRNGVNKFILEKSVQFSLSLSTPLSLSLSPPSLSLQFFPNSPPPASPIMVLIFHFDLLVSPSFLFFFRCLVVINCSYFD